MDKKLVRLTREELEVQINLPLIYKQAIAHALEEMVLPDDTEDAIWPDFFRAEVVNMESACELLDELKEDEYITEAGWFQSGWKARDSEVAEARKAGREDVVSFIESLAREYGAEMTGDGLKGIVKPIIFRDEWQAQLKEWGIKE